MHRSIFLICSMAFASCAFAQSTVKTYVTKQFKYFVYSSPNSNDDRHFKVDSIVIFRAPEQKRIQKIVPTENDYPGSAIEYVLFIDDWNFDGNEDISIAKEMAGANGLGLHWLYSPSKKRFVPNSQLDGVISAQIDSADQQIISYRRDDAVTYWEGIYKWFNGQLLLMEETMRTVIQKNDTHYKIITVKKRVNGKMKLVSKTKDKEE